MGCVWVDMLKMEPRYWWEYGDEKTRITSLNEKHSVIPWGLIVPIWKIIFFSRVFRAASRTA